MRRRKSDVEERRGEIAGGEGKKEKRRGREESKVRRTQSQALSPLHRFCTY